MKSSMKNRHRISLAIAALAAGGLLLTSCGGSSGSSAASNTPAPNAWMAETIVAEQAAAAGDTAKEAVANRRARLLIAAMTFDQKLQQLTGAVPEVIPEPEPCGPERYPAGTSNWRRTCEESPSAV